MALRGRGQIQMLAALDVFQWSARRRRERLGLSMSSPSLFFVFFRVGRGGGEGQVGRAEDRRSGGRRKLSKKKKDNQNETWEWV